MRKKASVDTNQANLFWEMMGLKKFLPAPITQTEEPNYPWPDYEKVADAYAKFTSNPLTSPGKYYQKYFDVPGVNDKTPPQGVGSLRAYYLLKNGKKASATITFRGDLEEYKARDSVKRYMDGQRLIETILYVAGITGSIFKFGYWMNEDSFYENDYPDFFPSSYPGVFRVVNCKIGGQYGGSHYMEVRLQEV